MCMTTWLDSLRTRVRGTRNRKRRPTKPQLAAYVERCEDRTLLSAPVAVDDSYSTPQNMSLYVPPMGVLDNDSDPDFDPLEAWEFSPPTNGTLILDPGGSFDYAPFPGFTGTDSFTYQAYDSFETLWSNVATVTIDVTPAGGGANNPPDAIDDTAAAMMDMPMSVDVLTNDTDPDPGDFLTLLSVTAGSMGGTTMVNADMVDYTPPPGYTGTETFNYTIQDMFGGQDTATVSVTVDAMPNNPPTAMDDSTSTMTDMPVTIDVLINDTDPDPGDFLTITGTSNVTPGATATITGSMIDYTPPAGFTGSDTFNYTIEDMGANSATATVTIDVMMMSFPPDAVDDPLMTEQDVSLLITISSDLLGNDIDNGGGLQFDSFDTTLTSGTVVDNLDGTLTYEPPPGFSGSDQFDYTVPDSGATSSDTATVFIDVMTADQPPVIIINFLEMSDSIVFDASGSYDPEGQPLQFTWTVDGSTYVTDEESVDFLFDELSLIDWQHSDLNDFHLAVTDGTQTVSESITIAFSDAPPPSSPTAPTVPAAPSSVPPEWLSWYNSRASLDITNSGDSTFVNNALAVLDTTYALGTIPTLNPGQATPAYYEVKGDRSRSTGVMIGIGLQPPVFYPRAKPADVARINIRVNLQNLKQELVNEFNNLLTANPPKEQDGTVIPLTAAEKKTNANKLADLYIKTVDNFLNTHPGAVRKQFRFAVLQWFGIQNDANCPNCDTWATAIQGGVDTGGIMADSSANPSDPVLNNLYDARRAQYHGIVSEHNFLAVFSKDYTMPPNEPGGFGGYIAPANMTAAIKAKVLLLDPWQDLLPRVFTTTEMEASGWGLTNLGVRN